MQGSGLLFAVKISPKQVNLVVMLCPMSTTHLPMMSETRFQGRIQVIRPKFGHSIVTKGGKTKSDPMNPLEDTYPHMDT